MSVSTSNTGFGYATAARLAAELTPRNSREPISIWQERVDVAACDLIRASITPGTDLNRFVTVTQRFLPQTARASELQLLAAEALRAVLPPIKHAPAYSLAAFQAAG